jgi:hypothetical protein
MEYDFDCKIEWEEFEKVVGQRVTQLRENCDSFLTYLKMIDKEMTFNELCCMFVGDFADMVLNDEEVDEDSQFHTLKTQELSAEFGMCVAEFSKKTEIPMYMDISLSKSDFKYKSYLCLDVLIATPNGFVYKDGAEKKLNKLRDSGVVFQLNDKDLC